MKRKSGHLRPNAIRIWYGSSVRFIDRVPVRYLDEDKNRAVVRYHHGYRVAERNFLGHWVLMPHANPDGTELQF